MTTFYGNYEQRQLLTSEWKRKIWGLGHSLCHRLTWHLNRQNGLTKESGDATIYQLSFILGKLQLIYILKIE